MTEDRTTLEAITEKAQEFVDKNIANRHEGLTKNAAAWVDETTGGNVSGETAKTAIPWLAGAGAAGVGLLAMKPIQWITEGLFKVLRHLVTGFGLFEKIPLVGGLFTAIGDTIESIGTYAGYAVPALAGVMGFKAFQVREEAATTAANTGGSRTPPTAIAGAAGIGTAITARNIYYHIPVPVSDLEALKQKIGAENYAKLNRLYDLDNKPPTGKELDAMLREADKDLKRYVRSQLDVINENMTHQKSLIGRIATKPFRMTWGLISQPLIGIANLYGSVARKIDWATSKVGVRIPGSRFQAGRAASAARVGETTEIAEQLIKEASKNIDDARATGKNVAFDLEGIGERFEKVSGRAPVGSLAASAEPPPLRLNLDAEGPPLARMRGDVGEGPALKITGDTEPVRGPLPETNDTKLTRPSSVARTDGTAALKTEPFALTNSQKPSGILDALAKDTVGKTRPQQFSPAAFEPRWGSMPENAPQARQFPEEWRAGAARSPNRWNMRAMGGTLAGVSCLQAGAGAYDFIHRVRDGITPNELPNLTISVGNAGVGGAGMWAGVRGMTDRALPKNLPRNLFRGAVILQIGEGIVAVSQEEEGYKNYRAIERGATVGISAGVGLGAGAAVGTGTVAAAALPVTLMLGTAIAVGYTGDQAIELAKDNDRVTKMLNDLRNNAPMGVGDARGKNINRSLKDLMNPRGNLGMALKTLQPELQKLGMVEMTEQGPRYDMSSYEKMETVRGLIKNKINQYQETIDGKSISFLERLGESTTNIVTGPLGWLGMATGVLPNIGEKAIGKTQQDSYEAGAASVNQAGMQGALNNLETLMQMAKAGEAALNQTASAEKDSAIEVPRTPAATSSLSTMPPKNIPRS